MSCIRSSRPPSRLVALLLVAGAALLPTNARADKAACAAKLTACGAPADRPVWLCFELDGATPRRVAGHGTLDASLTLLPANQAVTVVVLGSDDVDSLQITQAGKMGVTIAEPLKGGGIEPASAPLAQVLPAPCDAYVKTFGPRTAGDATISITVTPSADPKTPVKHDFEAHVPKVYSGAFRLGVSALYDSALDDSYATRQLLDSELHQVVNLGGSPGAIELVVGYAPFLWALAGDNAGRTFTDADPAHWRISPYLGLGVLSTTSDGVQWLRSVYLGGEVELAQGCSLALTGVLRRSETLAYGLATGDLVVKGTDVTQSTLSLGAALVLNFTPEFLTWASSVLPK